MNERLPHRLVVDKNVEALLHDCHAVVCRVPASHRTPEQARLQIAATLAAALINANALDAVASALSDLQATVEAVGQEKAEIKGTITGRYPFPRD